MSYVYMSDYPLEEDFDASIPTHSPALLLLRMKNSKVYEDLPMISTRRAGTRRVSSPFIMVDEYINKHVNYCIIFFLLRYFY